MKTIFLSLLLVLCCTALNAQRPARNPGPLNRSSPLMPGTRPAAPKLFAQFTANTSEYSARNAYLTMLASRHCYLDVVGAGTEAAYETTTRTIFQDWGFGRVSFPRNDRTSTQCIVASNPEMVLIAFRGSEFSAPGTPFSASVDINGWQASGEIELPRVLASAAIQDWIVTDAHLAPMSSPRWSGAKVHTGFGTALESVLDRIMVELNNPATAAAPGQSKPIFITGHSLGGALALLAAFRLKKEGYPVAGVYPHAAPLVGDIVFSAKYAGLNLPTFLSVNFRDIVTTFPSSDLLESYNRQVQQKALLKGRKASPAELIASYSHPPAKLKYISGDGSIFTNPSAETIRRDRGPLLGFSDHDSFLYCLKLYNAIPPAEKTGMVPPAR